ncbi:MAG: sigma-54-dependent Fis family transcriptional regulator, partial [Deltaproteobacteria bacterium]|nr:sigma-54-dependent Fis family transcriptional regulator [Deltaproteobacteria bacterium]
GSRLVTVDVRPITSTNRDLEQAAAERQFREDLYYRLKVVTITLPRLRERREDIPLLVEHFVKLFNEEHAKEIRGVDPRVIEVFMGYNWPGNVRELKNTVETMVVMSRKEVLGLEDIPFEISRLPREDRKVEIRVGMRLDAVEREVIRHTLTQVQGNKAKAARILGMGLSTLHRKIKRYGLQPAPAE